MVDRRSFLVACGWMVTLPALARARRLLATNSQSRNSLPAGPLKQQVPTVNAQPSAPVFRIYGWDLPFEPEQSTNADVWISVNQAWRTAWR